MKVERNWDALEIIEEKAPRCDSISQQVDVKLDFFLIKKKYSDWNLDGISIYCQFNTSQ